MSDTPATHPEPLFQAVFGADWHDLPPVMKKHYAVRGGSADEVTVSGTLDVKVSWFMGLMARVSGMLVPYSGRNIPVTVTFRSGADAKSLEFDRVFLFPGRKPVRFRSRMEHMGGNVLIEFMRFGVGWKLAYRWDGHKVILEHRGYVWRLAGLMIPLPLHWVIGRGHAEETPLDEDSFAMWTHSKHPLFGVMFGYAGTFAIDQT